MVVHPYSHIRVSVPHCPHFNSQPAAPNRVDRLIIDSARRHYNKGGWLTVFVAGCKNPKSGTDSSQAIVPLSTSFTSIKFHIVFHSLIFNSASRFIHYCSIPRRASFTSTRFRVAPRFPCHRGDGSSPYK